MLTKKTMEKLAKGNYPYLYEEAKPCPHCGKHPVQLRHVVTYANPYAVCCGGDGCCFYRSGATPEDAIQKWNESTDKTPCDRTMTKDGKIVPQKEIKEN